MAQIDDFSMAFAPLRQRDVTPPQELLEIVDTGRDFIMLSRLDERNSLTDFDSRRFRRKQALGSTSHTLVPLHSPIRQLRREPNQSERRKCLTRHINPFIANRPIPAVRS